MSLWVCNINEFDSIYSACANEYDTPSSFPKDTFSQPWFFDYLADVPEVPKVPIFRNESPANSLLYCSFHIVGVWNEKAPDNHERITCREMASVMDVGLSWRDGTFPDEADFGFSCFPFTSDISEHLKILKLCEQPFSINGCTCNPQLISHSNNDRILDHQRDPWQDSPENEDQQLNNKLFSFQQDFENKTIEDPTASFFERSYGRAGCWCLNLESIDLPLPVECESTNIGSTFLQHDTVGTSTTTQSFLQNDIDWQQQDTTIASRSHSSTAEPTLKEQVANENKRKRIGKHTNRKMKKQNRGRRINFEEDLERKMIYLYISKFGKGQKKIGAIDLYEKYYKSDLEPGTSVQANVIELGMTLNITIGRDPIHLYWNYNSEKSKRHKNFV